MLPSGSVSAHIYPIGGGIHCGSHTRQPAVRPSSAMASTPSLVGISIPMWGERRQDRLAALVLIAREAHQHEDEGLVALVGMAEPRTLTVGVLSAIEQPQGRELLVPLDGRVDVRGR